MKLRPTVLRANVPLRRALDNERGLTLTELTVVGVLATMVMAGLTAFYIGSQAMWIGGSTQALAQRDATLLVDAMSRKVHEAKLATVTPTDANHDQLSLSYADSHSVDFLWKASDQRVHLLVNAEDRGPVGDTPVPFFRLTTIDSSMVELSLAQLRTANGDTVNISSRFTLLGRQGP